MAFLLSFSPNLPLNPKLSSLDTPVPTTLNILRDSLSLVLLHFASFFLAQPQSLAELSTPSKPALNIANTKSWFQFHGDGFAIRVPPEFEDIMEPEAIISGATAPSSKWDDDSFGLQQSFAQC